MRNFPTLPATLYLCAVALCSIATANQVSVSVVSGRSFQGVVDERTNDTHLWIRSGTSNAAIRRGIRWERISQMTLNGTAATRRQVRAVAAAGEQERAGNVSPPPWPSQSAAAGQEAKQGNRKPAQVVSPRVAHLQIDARLGNWDADAENDGLVVRFYPLSRQGELVQTHGTLQIALVGTRRAKFHESPRQANVPFVIRHWSVPVRSHDIGKAIYLPFGSIHPERDLRISSYGDVRASLAAAGQGVFRAHQRYLRIRPFPFTESNLRWFGQ